MLMADNSWANLILNLKKIDKYLIKLIGCIDCYILHNLITLGHDR